MLFGLLKIATINLMNDLDISYLSEDDGKVKVKVLEDEYFFATITAATALLLFGNIVDNSQSQKSLMIISQLLLAGAYVVKAVLVAYQDVLQSKDDYLVSLLQTDQVCTAVSQAIYVLIQMQLFNWISKHQIAVLYGIYAACLSVSKILKLQVGLDDSLWYLYLATAALLAVFSGVDWYWFKFYPLEAGIFIDVSSRGREAFEQFKQIQDYIAVRGSRETVFSMMYRREQRRRCTIKEVLAYSEIQLLVFVGSLRHACNILQGFLAPQLIENLTRATEFQYYFEVLYSGAAFAFIVSTVLFQVVLGRNFAVALTLMQALQTVVSIFVVSIGFVIPQI